MSTHGRLDFNLIRSFSMSALYLWYLSSLFLITESARPGLLLLYRPIDVTEDCAFSGRMRYDLSFGMGMSDTITMVFRTLSDLDYACFVEVSAVSSEIHLIVVIKFPTNIALNCVSNGDAFMVMKDENCLRLCDLVPVKPMHSAYFVVTIKGRLYFRFLSNSSINTDINAYMYQVTVTAARSRPASGNCNVRNESLCIIEHNAYCLTNGAVCDGIKQCGVSDWFDERKASCSLPVEYLGLAPVVAVIAAIVCIILACGHILLRCLPPLASSYFIFNANEDNRLCIDPVLKPPSENRIDLEEVRRTSLIPVSSSSSSNDENTTVPSLEIRAQSSELEKTVSKRKHTVSEIIQEKMRYMTGKSRKTAAKKNENKLQDI